jgi:hypothetical protein
MKEHDPKPDGHGRGRSSGGVECGPQEPSSRPRIVSARVPSIESVQIHLGQCRRAPQDTGGTTPSVGRGGWDTPHPGQATAQAHSPRVRYPMGRATTLWPGASGTSGLVADRRWFLQQRVQRVVLPEVGGAPRMTEHVPGPSDQLASPEVLIHSIGAVSIVTRRIIPGSP